MDVTAEIAKVQQMSKEEREQHLNSLLTPEEQKSVIRRIDLRLVPWTAFLYTLNATDRNNLGNVKIINSETKNDILTELNMSGNDFNTAVALFFITYVLFEIPSNMVIKYFGPRRHLTRIIILWGISSLCMAFTQNLGGMIACRIALGIAEAGYYAGMMFVYSAWYTQEEIGQRISWFYSAGSLAGAFAGLIAYAVSFMNGAGGYSGWRWVFVFEGSPSIIAGFLSYFIIPDFPRDEKWLNEREKMWLEQRLGANAPSAHDKNFDKDQFLSVFLDIHSYTFSLFYFLHVTALYGIVYYLPTIIRNMGFVSTTANLMTVPPYVAAAVFMAAYLWNSDRTGERGLHLLVLEIGFCVALLIYLLVDPAQPGGIGALYFAAVLGVCTMLAYIPLIWAWRSGTSKGTTHTAIAAGLMNSFGNVGGAIGTYIFDPKWAPRYQPSFGIMVAFSVGAMIFILYEWNYRRLEDKRRANLLATAV